MALTSENSKQSIRPRSRRRLIRRSGDDHDVSEDRLHQIANALWVLSSFLTMRGNSAVTRLAQGWMLAGVLALDWSALVWVRRRSGRPRSHLAPGCFQELGAELALAV